MCDNNNEEGLGNAEETQHFQNYIDGIHGQFETPSGKLNYIQTKAKIGGHGPHAQITKNLVPAREALNINEMDFNQLLQRDLDDHRIATKLIPYLLEKSENGLAGFYPPIVAFLLPFDRNLNPVDVFPEPKESLRKDSLYRNLKFKCFTHGEAYKIQYFSDNNGNVAHEPPLAVLRWNPDLAKLVIMDGQHRAMSLLAIERTISNTWTNSPKGARYQPFYESHVQRLLEEAKNDQREIILSNIELPVTICWCPENEGDERRPNPHKTARKLFVDVNNTAKPPSEARLVLLSDARLENVFARDLLNRLRRDSEWTSSFPLYAVEYDNPRRAVTTPRRWSVVTNLEILKDAVLRTTFGPEKYLTNASVSLQGKPPWQNMNLFFRRVLGLEDIFQSEFWDGERHLLRDDLGNTTFPTNDPKLHENLLNAFYDKRGRGILKLLSGVLPYKAHISALRNRYLNRTPADNVQTLAKDALFEGVGMFWTIEDGHQVYLDEKADAREKELPEPPRTEVSQARKILDEEQKSLFKAERADLYFGNKTEETLKDCENLYPGIITYAAQVGLVMAWASILQVAGEQADPAVVAEAFVKSINDCFEGGPTQTRNRKRFLQKTSELNGFKPFNLLPKLDPSFAIHYRYLWLVLATEGGLDNEYDSLKIDKNRARKFLADSRSSYLRCIVDDREKLRRKDSDLKDKPTNERNSEAKARAIKEVREEQAQAWCYWFGGKIDEHRRKLSSELPDLDEFREEEKLHVDLDEDEDEDEDEELVTDDFEDPKL